MEPCHKNATKSSKLTCIVMKLTFTKYEQFLDKIETNLNTKCINFKDYYDLEKCVLLKRQRRFSNIDIKLVLKQ